MSKHTIIIAEAGVNHNGSLELAKKMVDVATECGVDYIKFQTFKAESLVNASAPQAEYQIENTKQLQSQLEMLKQMELSDNDFTILKSYCNKAGVKFLSTAFDNASVDFLCNLGTDFLKVPSGEISNLPYLRNIASKKIPVIMSTGMCELEDISLALDVLYQGGLTADDITLLHCNTEYPTPMADVNLRAMLTLHNQYGTRVGYSDHTKGIEVPIAAVALGASVIEKHFTLDRSLPGPDHVASLEPTELKQLVDSIRNLELALGNGEKHITESERKNIKVARKSIVALRDISAGELLTEDNITVKRPGTGINPMNWDTVIGSRAVRNFKADELIEL